MWPRKLVKPSNKLLHTKLEPFEFDGSVDPVELKNHLIEVMEKENGIGLSANQLGLPYRVFVMRAEEPFACFNPVITTYYENDDSVMEEGCLTYPLLYVRIKRPKVIRAKWQDEFGETHVKKFIGLTSRVFQHEYDHMEGRDYLSRANKINLNRAKEQHRLLMRKMKRHKGTKIMESEEV